MAIWDRSDNWLGGIAASDHTNHTIKNGSGELSVESIQKAFDISYGVGRFNVRNHGQVITVFSVEPFLVKVRNCIARAERSGNQADLQKFTAMLSKYEDAMK